MNFKTFKILAFLFSSIIILNGCAQGKLGKLKSFKHDTPLIKENVKELGKKELEKSAEMGPSPVEADVIKLKKENKYLQ